MFIKLALMCLLLLGWSVAAYAQVGVCPAGTIPNGTQTSAMECAPDPNYDAQSAQPAPPPPVWADRWGAIAGSLPGFPPAFGAAANMPTKSTALAAALEKCEATPNTRCGIDMTYANQCIAVAQGKGVAQIDTGATLDLAERLSMTACKANGDATCAPYYSACSYPVRIQ